MGRKVFRLLLLPLTLSFCLSLSSAADAHGVLERSDPPANTTLDVPPRAIVLWMNEPVDPAFSSVAVVDLNGKRVAGGATVSGNGRQLIVAPGRLPRGVYAVKWRVLSRIDGHTTSGTLLFAVGQPLPSGRPPEAIQAPPPALIIVRWAGLITAMLLVGGAIFQALVLRPATRHLATQGFARSEHVQKVLRTVTVTAGVILLVSLVGEVLIRAATLLDIPLPELVGRGMLWSFVGGTRPGWSFLVRMAMALLLLLPRSPEGRILQATGLIWFIIVGGLMMVLGGPLTALGGSHVVLLVLASSVYALVGVMMALLLPRMPDLHLPQLPWVPPLAGVGLMAGFAITAHASGRGILAVIADVVHLLAAASWLGGLVALLLSLRTMPAPDRPRLAQILVPRFSTLAGISLGVLVGTGVFSATLHLPTLRAFAATPYGRTLLIKLLLVLPWAALGAINHFVLRPRLAAGNSHPTVLRRFLRLVTGEVGLGVIVLLVVAVLTITPPPKGSTPAAAQKPLILAGLAGDVRVDLRIMPAQPGWNRYEAAASSGDGTPLEGDARIRLLLVKLDEDVDPTAMFLAPEGGGRYAAEGGEMALPGLWEVTVVIRRRGRLDVSTTFPLHLGQTRPAGSDRAAEALLEQARRATASLRAWREVEQLTDGNGNVVVTRYELIPPGRLHYRTGSQPPAQTSGGNEAIILGATRYMRADSGPWERDTLPNPIVVEGPMLFMRGAEGVVRGRRDQCGDESCQIVVWTGTGGTPAFAGWIGLKTFRVHKLLMAAPAHYMTLRAFDFNATVRIEAPR